MSDPFDPAATDLRQRQTFGALVRAAAANAQAAEGLAAAFCAYDPPERQRFIEAVVADAACERVSPLPALAAMLSTESDPDLAQAISHAMRAHHDQASGRVPSAGSVGQGWLAGDGEDGGAAVVRPLFGALVDISAVVWMGRDVTHIRTEPVATATAVRPTFVSWLSATAHPAAWTEVPVSVAIDHITQALWRHYRHAGVMPTGASRLMNLFN